MTNFGNIIIALMAVLIIANVLMVFTLVSTRSDLREFQQETVLEIESIKDRLGDIEYRVHKLEHPAYEDIVKGDIDNG